MTPSNHYAGGSAASRWLRRLPLTLLSLVAFACSGQPSLHDAVKRGDIGEVQHLIKVGADVHATDSDGLTPLHWAAWQSRVVVAKALIEAGADMDAQTRRSGVTPLQLAVQEGDPDMVELLIAVGAHVNVGALRQAVKEGDTAIVSLLIAAGANVSEDPDQLFYWVKYNKHDAVGELLMTAGAEPPKEETFSQTWARFREEVAKVEASRSGTKSVPLGAEDQKGTTPVPTECEEPDHVSVTTPPLIGAVICGDVERAKKVVGDGTHLNDKDPLGLTALHHAVKTHNAAMVELLIAAGADVNASGLNMSWVSWVNLWWGLMERLNRNLERNTEERSRGPAGRTCRDRTPLCVAAASGDTQVTKLLVAAGADVKTEGLLREAVDRDDVAMTKELIAAGADVKTPGLLGKAIETNDTRMVEVLVAAGAEVNERHGASPLHQVAGKRNPGLVKQLLAGGADVNASGDHHDSLPPAGPGGYHNPGSLVWDQSFGVGSHGSNIGTPLHWAVRKGDVPMVELLIAAGADLNSKDYLGDTPLHAAAGRSNTIARRLIAAGADVNASNSNLHTPLHYAAAEGDTAMLEFLVAAGASVHSRNSLGKTPLGVAKGKTMRWLDPENGPGIVKRLSRYGARE